MTKSETVLDLDAWEKLNGVDRFLKKHPGMRRRSIQSDMNFKEPALILQGRFDFRAETGKYGLIEDSYPLTIKIPLSFPDALPKVFLDDDSKKRIDHVNGDRSLCLTTEFKQKVILKSLSKDDTALEFYITRLLVPFLTANSCGECLYGEHLHGYLGYVETYMELFQKEVGRDPSKEELLGMVGLLGLESFYCAYYCACPLHNYSHKVSSCIQAQIFYNKYSPIFTKEEWTIELSFVIKGLEQLLNKNSSSL